MIENIIFTMSRYLILENTLITKLNYLSKVKYLDMVKIIFSIIMASILMATILTHIKVVRSVTYTK